MPEFTPLSATLGGALLGLASVLLLKLNGRIAGISGILNGTISAVSGDRLWRILFVIGLVAGGYGYQRVTGEALITREGFSTVTLITAGLLVGFGSRLGSGCTSGHGVCGVARLSPRSIVATLTFLVTGMTMASLVYVITAVSS